MGSFVSWIQIEQLIVLSLRHSSVTEFSKLSYFFSVGSKLYLTKILVERDQNKRVNGKGCDSLYLSVYEGLHLEL